MSQGKGIFRDVEENHNNQDSQIRELQNKAYTSFVYKRESIGQVPGVKIDTIPSIALNDQ